MKVAIARNAGIKASLDIRRAVPLFVLDIRTNKDKGLALALSQNEATERTKEHNRAYCYLFRSKMKEKPVFLLYFAHLFVSLALKSAEDRLHLGKIQLKFGFSLDLHYLCRRLLLVIGAFGRQSSMKCVAIISCSESSLFGDGVTLRNGVSVHFSARLIEIVVSIQPIFERSKKFIRKFPLIQNRLRNL